MVSLLTSAAASILGKVAALSIAKAVGIGVALGTLVTTSLVVLSPLSSRAPSASAPGREQAPIVEGRPSVTSAPRAARDEGPPWVLHGVARPPSGAEPVTAAAPDPAATPEHAAAAPSAGGAVPEGTSEGIVSRGRDDREVARDGVRDAPTPSIAEATAAPSVASFVAQGEPPPASDVAPRPSAAPPTVQEEARLVGRAREALRGGDPALALQRLEEIRLRFPGGVVRQEREALTIEALVRLGRRDDAARRAAAFVREFPASPYVTRVKDLVPVP
jgi:hypothetical protein